MTSHDVLSSQKRLYTSIQNTQAWWVRQGMNKRTCGLRPVRAKPNIIVSFQTRSNQEAGWKSATRWWLQSPADTSAQPGWRGKSVTYRRTVHSSYATQTLWSVNCFCICFPATSSPFSWRDAGLEAFWKEATNVLLWLFEMPGNHWFQIDISHSLPSLAKTAQKAWRGKAELDSWSVRKSAKTRLIQDSLEIVECDDGRFGQESITWNSVGLVHVEETSWFCVQMSQALWNFGDWANITQSAID